MSQLNLKCPKGQSLSSSLHVFLYCTNDIPVSLNFTIRPFEDDNIVYLDTKSTIDAKHFQQDLDKYASKPNHKFDLHKGTSL
jgi:hypothetical protein